MRFLKLLFDDCVYRASSYACTAVDALVKVDDILSISLDNSLNGALIDTCAASDAIAVTTWIRVHGWPAAHVASLSKEMMAERAYFDGWRQALA